MYVECAADRSFLDDALLQYSQVSNLGRPDKASISDVRRWIADTTIDTVHLPTLGPTLSSDNGDHVALTQQQTQRTGAWKLTEGMLWRLLAKVSAFADSDGFKFSNHSSTPHSEHHEAGSYLSRAVASSMFGMTA